MNLESRTISRRLEITGVIVAISFAVACVFASRYEHSKKDAEIISTGESVSVQECQICPENEPFGYALGSRHFIARTVKQSDGECDMSWFFFDQSAADMGIKKDTLLQNTIFTRSDAWTNEDDVTSGDIEVRVVVII